MPPVPTTGAATSPPTVFFQSSLLVGLAFALNGPSRKSANSVSTVAVALFPTRTSPFGWMAIPETATVPVGTLNCLLHHSRVTATGVAAAITTPVAVTRLWWSRQFSVPTGTVAVSGIAIHPNGDVLVGNNATATVETLFALFRDGPFNANASPTRSEDWKKTVGGLVAAPVVGTGGIGTASVYV